MKFNFILSILLISFALNGQIIQNNPEAKHANKFEQMGQSLRSPNEYRGADGYPGPAYFQQKADYKIKCSLDTKEQKLIGSEVITYHNNSPVELKYLWVQLDENEHAMESDKHRMNTSRIGKTMSEGGLNQLEAWRVLEKFGINIRKVVNKDNKPLKYTINGTMMRIDLPKPLKAGKKMKFTIDWDYYLIDRMSNPSWGRGGYEYFEDHGNYLYTMVQWFPRMCVYNDFEGWQNKQFVGRGEFALSFGDYEVEMTLPSDHVVAGTGECQNYKKMLTKAQYKRWEQAQNVKTPLEIVTKTEALANEKTPISTKNKTWKYKAKNVRDFAWTASKKFVWDALPHMTSEGKKVMCMSLYGKEAYPIYNKYSTKVVDHTLRTYSKYSIPYPYPVAISVEAANGMEYPMISFNPGRAEEEKQEKYGDNNYYELHFSNKGGLVMPIKIEWTFKDGSKEIEEIPVEIWRLNEEKFRKVFVKDKEVTGIVIDPFRETADIDESNNNWPVKELPSRFQVYKKNNFKEKLNPMQKALGKEIKP